MIKASENKEDDMEQGGNKQRECGRTQGYKYSKIGQKLLTLKVRFLLSDNLIKLYSVFVLGKLVIT